MEDGRGTGPGATPAEVTQSDAAIVRRIADAVEQADFEVAPLPDFSGITHNLRHVLDDLAERAERAGRPHDQVREALAHLTQARAEQQ